MESVEQKKNLDSSETIFSERRKYNRWVSNQTLEDYALRYTSKKARRWSFIRVVITALGGITFLALEAIGGITTINFGFYNAFLALLTVGSIIFITSLPISYYAAKYGVDIDLLSRGAGFGYIGSTITSLVYALFTFIFFAIEAAIMATVLEMLLDIPIRWGYIISALVIIPLVTHGITFISRFQLVTQPIWLSMQLAPFIFILISNYEVIDTWTGYKSPIETNEPSFNIVLFGAASSVLFSLIAQVGEQVDFIRFLPEKTSQNTKRWWISLFLSGPGWILIGGLKILAGSLLAVLLLSSYEPVQATNPVNMYMIAFSYMTQKPEVLFSLLGIFIVLSQIKINVTNAYAGSIAWSNFFSRLTHHHPGRVVWLVFNVGIALLMMQMNIYAALESILKIYSIMAVAWIGTLFSDLTINKSLGLSPKKIEFIRGHLFPINPVGVLSMGIASAIGISCFLFGEAIINSIAPFIALVTSILLTPFFAFITKGEFYIARESKTTKEQYQCKVCEHHYEPEDMTYCPLNKSWICSLCCSLDARCHDQCHNSTIDKKPTSIFNIISMFPIDIGKSNSQRFIYFVGFISFMALILGTIIWSARFNMANSYIILENLDASLLQIFVLLMVVMIVLGWIFVLTNESRSLALNESIFQTNRLSNEIRAHEETAAELKDAKEIAEAANLAKNRYLSGISHELRTPLNSLLGYTQLLERDKTIAPEHLERISLIRRSGDYLADLIEGLLDISRIEAGKLEIYRNTIAFKPFIDELVVMFESQAHAKGLDFQYELSGNIPDYITCDQKHLKQILINLLSNAIKYTNNGYVKFHIKYRYQIAEFLIEDSGVGIHSDDIGNIFKPFNRINSPKCNGVSGAGLGLTICQLLTDIMGGELNVTSQPSIGSQFSVHLMLSSTDKNYLDYPKPSSIKKYNGSNKNFAIVDDQKDHRNVLAEMVKTSRL